MYKLWRYGIIDYPGRYRAGLLRGASVLRLRPLEEFQFQQRPSQDPDRSLVARRFRFKIYDRQDEIPGAGILCAEETGDVPHCRHGRVHLAQLGAG